MGFDALSLPPSAAMILFIAAVIAGVNFRRVWKVEGPTWQLWIYGLTAGICLCVVGFIPLKTG